MDVDLSALKALERDKEISMEVLLSALTEALLNAYEKTPGAGSYTHLTLPTN
jgi:N utilization substance protein A